MVVGFGQMNIVIFSNSLFANGPEHHELMGAEVRSF
jgi:hypothetical protein